MKLDFIFPSIERMHFAVIAFHAYFVDSTVNADNKHINGIPMFFIVDPIQ